MCRFRWSLVLLRRYPFIVWASSIDLRDSRIWFLYRGQADGNLGIHFGDLAIGITLATVE